MNKWYRNQPEVFPSTLELELSVARFAKLLAHNCALYRPSLRQMSQMCVLTAAVSACKFDMAEWLTWSSSTLDLPLSRQRKALQQRIGQQQPAGKRQRAVFRVLKKPGCKDGRLRKRPASVVVTSIPDSEAPKKKMKRTPFTLQRNHLQ